ncbi:uncharacterized protein PAC_09651 [Phialocephala subalpina]|uniref:Uncharacterized protein n=1 Tax=Phialocephala subalpina TaxID=576137 RepID=A0A1L7X431_9HELO|nr:uncharacterized protein PAC_09651 [Phialocephala subalpina]
MASREKNQYWIPNLEISKKVITQELQYYLGPEATKEDGFLITTPGECLTDEQIDDICLKSKEVWEKQAAARSKKDADKQLKRPLHRPILLRGSRPADSTRFRRHSDERGDGVGRRRSGERRYDVRDRY